jgi:type VI secretion system secreted protein Hcp
MPIYMKYGPVQGDVTEAGHQRWIELTSVDWSIARPVANAAGSSTPRALASPSVSELAVTKLQDVATIPLVQESLKGTPRDVQIDFLRTARDRLEVYYTIRLTATLVTRFAQHGADERPHETLTLNFTAIKVEGAQMAEDGKSAAPASYGWDLRAAAPT